MTTITIRQPYYNPRGGHTYRVRAHYEDRCEESFHRTERDALDKRDKAFDRGAHSVHVAGLPFHGAAAGFPSVATPLNIIDD